MNTENTTIEAIIVHEIGDKSLQQSLVLSQSLIKPDSEELQLLKGFFLDHFKGFEFYNFRMASATVPTSRIYQPVAEIFNDPASLLASASQIARLLYPYTESELLSHGYLFICYFRDVMTGDELTDAVGIYFCPAADTFITPENIGTNPMLRFRTGTFIGKHEMACIVFDTDDEQGYKIDLIDKSKKNKGHEIIRWPI